MNCTACGKPITDGPAMMYLDLEGVWHVACDPRREEFQKQWEALFCGTEETGK
jgi:hypothetical protein